MRHLESKSVFTSVLDDISKLCLLHGGLWSLRCLSIQTRSRQLLPISETFDDSNEKTVKKSVQLNIIVAISFFIHMVMSSCLTYWTLWLYCVNDKMVMTSFSYLNRKKWIIIFLILSAFQVKVLNFKGSISKGFLKHQISEKKFFEN